MLSSYSYDYVVVPESDCGTALVALARAGFPSLEQEATP